jgi:LysR family transcriptional regulator, regulator for bpeEF and oprC
MTRKHLSLSQRIAGVDEFVRVAEHKSFVRAAEALNVTTSGVARAVRLLEERLGVKLLHRTTRRVNLTEDGQAFYASAKRITADFDEAASALARASVVPQGTLRVDMPIAYGRLVMLPHLVSFMAKYPQVRLESRFNDRYVDLVEEGVDVAVRIGTLNDSSMVARRVGAMCYGTYACKDYLRQHGEPKHPNELQDHSLLAFVFPTGKTLSLSFERGDERVAFSPDAARATFNNGEAMLEAASLGLGIAQAPDFHATAFLKNKTLKPILTDWQATGHAIQLVYPSAKHLSAKVRVFVDHMVESLAPG